MPARIAVIGLRFDPEKYLREFARQDTGLLRQYEPEALVAPLGDLLTLADLKLRNRLELPELSVAVVAVTSLDDTPLGPHYRDMLWRAFEVPVFEQLMDDDGRIIARECEVHNGLHLFDEAAEQELVSVEDSESELDRAGCICGRMEPRLINLVRIHPVHLRHAAAGD